VKGVLPTVYRIKKLKKLRRFNKRPVEPEIDRYEDGRIFPVIRDYFVEIEKETCAHLDSEMLLNTGAVGDSGNRVKACNRVTP
jgi:hypothetical protein